MRTVILFLSLIRGIFANIFTIVITGIYSVLTAIFCLIFRHKSVGTFFLRSWGFLILWAHGIRVQTEGLENLPLGGAIYLFNHTSHFDIPIVHRSIPKDLRFGAKIELFSIPFFGPAMRAVGALPIVRSNRGEVLKLYEYSIQKVTEGICFILAPEGTRQDGKQIGRFKSGPFIFAIQGGFQIVPLILYDVAPVLPKNTLWPNKGKLRSKVRVKILPPVSTTGYSLETRSKLQQEVFELYQRHYSEAGL